MRSTIVLLALISTTLHGGVNRWTSSGPEGASIQQIVADPSNAQTAYAVTSAGIFKTSNGGQTWRDASEGLANTRVTALTIRPDAPSTLFAALGSSIYETVDGGNLWVRRGVVPGRQVAVLALESDSNVLNVGTDDGVYQSNDGGRHWFWIAPDIGGHILSLERLHGIVCGIRVPQTVGTVFQINSDGTSRELFVDIVGVIGLVADHQTSVLYAYNANAIYQTHDGLPWTRLLKVDPSNSIRRIGPAVNGALYAEIDGRIARYQGGEWVSLGAGVDAVAVSASDPSLIYARRGRGIAIRRPSDADWTSADAGLPRALAADVAVVDRDTAYAAVSSSGLQKTADAARNWRQADPDASTVVTAVPDSKIAFASARFLKKTTDGGATWQLSGSQVRAIAVAPSDQATVYAAFANLLAKSSNGGSTWTSASWGIPVDYFEFYYGLDVAAIAVCATDSNTAYLAKPQGVFRTTNGGQNWDRVFAGPTPQSVAIDAGNPSVVYVGFGGGVSKSTDAGATWTPSGLSDKTVNSLVLRGESLFAATSDGHVYRSDDGGASWFGLDDGLTRAAISKIDADRDARHLYAATWAGIYDYAIARDDLQIERIATPDLSQPSTFVIPVTGSTTGAGGTQYSTEVTFTNDGDAPQDIVATWLPGTTSFRIVMPPGPHRINFAEKFGITGIGALAITRERDAAITAVARIWRQTPDLRAPSSQLIPAVAFTDHKRAIAEVRGTNFRVNVGIVNLSSAWHQFTIEGQTTVAVPPMSLLQVSIPGAYKDDLTVSAIADGVGPWILYASAIDQITGEARTTIGGTNE